MNFAAANHSQPFQPIELQYSVIATWWKYREPSVKIHYWVERLISMKQIINIWKKDAKGTYGFLTLMPIYSGFSRKVLYISTRWLKQNTAILVAEKVQALGCDWLKQSAS